MKTNKSKSETLAIVATFLSIAAYVLYNWRGSTSEVRPNISSWLVWSFMTILNFTSYKKVTESWTKSLLPTVNSLMCIVTAILAFRTGSLRNLSTTEWCCLVLGVVAALWWWKSKSAVTAQILLQLALLIGGIPTIIKLWHAPTSEPWLSWFLWTLSFTCQYFAVKYTWKKQIEFLYPVCTTLFHGLIFVLTLRQYF